jgi:hypothetical protein
MFSPVKTRVGIQMIAHLSIAASKKRWAVQNGIRALCAADADLTAALNPQLSLNVQRHYEAALLRSFFYFDRE